ncbi:MAG: hypothetical protein H6719_24070 [Sandaracinaceae bacterium]|nr:hypothetical protein [Sandaracinaceae bacterium]
MPHRALHLVLLALASACGGADSSDPQTAESTEPEPATAGAEADVCVYGNFMTPPEAGEAGTTSVMLSYPRYSNNGYAMDHYGDHFEVAGELTETDGEIWLRQAAGDTTWTLVSDPGAQCPPRPEAGE